MADQQSTPLAKRHEGESSLEALASKEAVADQEDPAEREQTSLQRRLSCQLTNRLDPVGRVSKEDNRLEKNVLQNGEKQ